MRHQSAFHIIIRTALLSVAVALISISCKSPEDPASTRTTISDWKGLELSEFVLIPPGQFMMGSPEDEMGRDTDEIIHPVIISTQFYIQKTEVTQSLWDRVMGDNPSVFQGANRPIENITWMESIEFCNRLSDLQGLSRCYTFNRNDVLWNPRANGYRLPTEAEWEYSCRAGSTLSFYNGHIWAEGCNDQKMNELGWFCGNSDNETHEPAAKTPNSWGLYDMSGNVWEMCWDFYGEYLLNEQTDPSGPESGSVRTARGGSWRSGAQACRCASRIQNAPEVRSDSLGLRLVRSYQ